MDMENSYTLSVSRFGHKVPTKNEILHLNISKSNGYYRLRRLTYLYRRDASDKIYEHESPIGLILHFIGKPHITICCSFGGDLIGNLYLTKPVCKNISTLQHQCRVHLNRAAAATLVKRPLGFIHFMKKHCLCGVQIDRATETKIPPGLMNFMKQYPYTM